MTQPWSDPEQQPALDPARAASVARRGLVLVLVLVLFLAGCHCAKQTPGPAPASAPAPAPALAPPRTVVDQDAFLASLDPAKSIDVRVAGDGEESVLGHKKCAYWEWMYGERGADGKLASWTIAYHSESPVTLIAGARQTTISYRTLRAYLTPEWEHEYHRGDAGAPAVVAHALAAPDAPPALYVAEYCLEVGRTYRATAHDDHFETPRPGGIATHTNRVLRVSDGATKATPAYRGWTY